MLIMLFKHDGRSHSSKLRQGAVRNLQPGSVGTYSLHYGQLDFNQSINQYWFTRLPIKNPMIQICEILICVLNFAVDF